MFNDMALRELHLFAGAGGGILGSELLGFHTVAACEIDPYCRKVLLQRQIDGILRPFPIWDDVRTFDGKPWKGKVDIVSGGFPCQDISCAGTRKGISGKRSGLWDEMARIIGEIRPSFVFVENSPMLVIRGLDVVLGDLASLGFNARWGIIGARHAGAPHRRDRIWILATNAERFNALVEQKPESGSRASIIALWNGAVQQMADSASAGLERRIGLEQTNPRRKTEKNIGSKFAGSGREFGKPWKVESGLGRVANGVPHRMDRLKAIGNGQVPEVVRLAFEKLIEF